MVYTAVCGEEGLLDVQTYRRLDKPRKDIPLGFIEVLPTDYVQWGEECDKWRMRFAGSGFAVQGS